jgi:hypothetical protein
MLPIFADIDDSKITSPVIANVKTQGRGSAGGGPSLLEIMKEVYGTPVLTPVPYMPGADPVQDMLRTMKNKEVGPAINGMVAKWHLATTMSDEDFNSKIEELIYISTLITFATGREGRKPRLDFFLMHLVTSVLFLPSMFKVIREPIHRIRILRHFLGIVISLCIYRGMPKINCNLVMSYSEFPEAPSRGEIPRSIVGDEVRCNTHVNPWPLIIQSILLAPDSHTIKTLRTLVYGNRLFGLASPGSMIGAFDSNTGEETHPGSASVDGTLWVRCAGVLADTMGWVAEGERAASDWDRSGLGWDSAWEGDSVRKGVAED